MSRIKLYEPARSDGGSKAFFIIEEKGETQGWRFYDRITLTENYRRSCSKFYQGEFDVLTGKSQDNRRRNLKMLEDFSFTPGGVFEVDSHGVRSRQSRCSKFSDILFQIHRDLEADF